ncbi:SurA N-terminal domain-containing protein [Candidatus Manganitrophus noduliformans]|uniref:Peptidylprolyl isomerase n=1 Tax=Candidatus Manganitrophus noduliformans TaxID=2606439 RepID=A0A7X6DL39_9BACT|nr:SurA N-terminal domain-containing protein [Candidatus Manganitrophus noduliformans]NKE69167.1 hypothetical protein [Candidatus Manganitrophus noduliformans]
MRCLIFILLLSLPAFSAIGFAAEPVERIAATLNDKIIFLSDLQRHQTFFENAGKNMRGEDSKTLLDRVVDNRLLRLEARRFVLQGPTETEIQQRLKVLRERFKTEAAFEEALGQTGLSLDELKQEIKEQLWVEKLLQERIHAFVFISPKEVTRYYQEHAADFGGKKQEEVEPIIRKILSEEKRMTKEMEYLARLRSHAEIQVNLQ